jgi:hypothetical protein
VEITFENHTPSALVLFSVDVDLFSADSMSKRERKEGVVRPGGTYSFYVPGVPSELRIKDFNTEATVHTETEGVNPVRPLYSGMWRIGETWEHWVGIDVRHAQAVTSALSGLWTYRSFRNPTAVSRTGPQKAQPAAHELILLEADFNLQRAIDPTTLQGTIEWEGGGLDLQGTADGANFDIVGAGRPNTPTAGWEYRYHGHLIPGWPKPPDANAVDQRPNLVGSVVRAKPHGNSPAGSVYPFVAVKGQPPFTSELSGSWIYRNFNPAFVEGDQTPPQLIVGEGVFKLETPTSTTLQGAFELPGGFLDLLNGRVQSGAGGEPSSFEIVGTGRPDTSTAGWQYDYHGHLTRVPALVGSVIRAKSHNGRPDGWRSPAGVVLSFIAVKQ